MIMEQRHAQTITLLKLAATFVSTLLVSGCPGMSNVQPNDARQLSYNLTETQAKLVFILKLKSCAKEYVVVEPDIKILTSAVADKNFSYSIKVSKLNSSVTERDLNISLYDHGAIKSLNSTTNDKTLAVVGNILKTAALLGGLYPTSADTSTESAGTRCNATTIGHYERRKNLSEKIQQLRDKLDTVAPAQAEGTIALINALAAEVARLNMEHLELPLAVKVDLSDPQRPVPQKITWKGKDLAKWTGSKEEKPYPELQFIVSLSIIGTYNQSPATGSSTNLSPSDCPEDPGCTQTIVFREPVDVEISVVPNGSALVDGSGKPFPKSEPITNERIAVSQWGQRTFLSLDVAVGEQSTTSMSLDPYGRQVQFGWKSNARANSVFEGSASVLEAYGTYKSSTTGKTELELATEELQALDTYKKLNALRACEEIIRAGGFKCPE